MHTSPNIVTANLILWVAGELRGLLAKHGASHLLRDTAQLVRDIRGMRVPLGSYLVKFDVKQYFMIGSPDALLYACVKDHGLPSERADILRGALSYLLRNQYVASPFWPHRRYHVEQGSGMGLQHSGEVADLSLFNFILIYVYIYICGKS